MKTALSMLGAGALALTLSACVEPETRPDGGDATVPGTNYNATGPLPCAMRAGEPLRSNCSFGVVRDGYDGTGYVTVTKPDGRTRTIFFQKGRAVSYDQSSADSAQFSSYRGGDITTVLIGDERYEIVDAIIFGG